MSLSGSKNTRSHMEDNRLRASFANMDIRTGLVPGSIRALVHGFHLAVDGASTPVLAPNAGVGSVPDYTVQFAAATTLRLISTSANDDAAGTGVTLVQIDGLDANYNKQIELVTMNGTSFTTATTNTFIAVNEMISAAAGSGMVNAGDIYCSDATDTATAGVPDNIIYHGIKVGWGVSMTAIYTVPLGFTAINIHYNWASGAATNANPGVFHPTSRVGGVDLVNAYLWADRGAGDYPLPSALPLPEKTILYIRTSRFSSSTPISLGSYWHFNLVKTVNYPGLN